MKEIKVRLKFSEASVSSNGDKINLRHATLEPMGSCIDSKPHKLRTDSGDHDRIYCKKCGCTICAEAIIAVD